MDYEKAGL